MSEVLDTRYLLYKEKFLPKQTNFLEHSPPPLWCLSGELFNSSAQKIQLQWYEHESTVLIKSYNSTGCFPPYNSFPPPHNSFPPPYDSFLLEQQLAPRTTASHYIMYCRKCRFNNPTTLQNCENEIFDPKDFHLSREKPPPPALESSVKTGFLFRSV